jgi:type I restriction enzyme S subunit
MGLRKYKLGELIELTDERNTTGKYLLDDVKGISTEKRFIDTKANMDGVSLDSYKVVNYREFAYVPDTSRRGDKIALAFNNDIQSLLISSIYTTFKCNRLDILIPEYLYIFFNRPEFDRYSRFNSWGSARETFSWEDFCDIDITLPSIEQQRKYVDVYLSLQNNLATYQSKVDDLKLVCDGYIEKLRRDYLTNNPFKMVRIGDYITKRIEINDDGKIQLEQGINIQKQFITPQRANSNLYGRRIVRKGDIAYCTQLNNENVAVAYRDGEDCVVSSVYDIIYVNDVSSLLPKYLMLWLVRPEFGRYVYTRSTGSAYEFLSFDDLADYKIPLPDLKVQQAIVNIYDCANKRKAIAAQLKEQLNNLCPILIKGSLQN